MTFDSVARRLINVVQSPRTVTAVMGKVSLRTKVALAFVVAGLIFVASQALLRLLRYIWIERGLRKAVKKYYLKIALGALLITGALDLLNVLKEQYGAQVAKASPLLIIVGSVGMTLVAQRYWGKVRRSETPHVGKVDAWVVTEFAKMKAEIAALSQVKELTKLIEQVRSDQRTLHAKFDAVARVAAVSEDVDMEPTADSRSHGRHRSKTPATGVSQKAVEKKVSIAPQPANTEAEKEVARGRSVPPKTGGPRRQSQSRRRRRTTRSGPKEKCPRCNDYKWPSHRCWAWERRAICNNCGGRGHVNMAWKNARTGGLKWKVNFDTDPKYMDRVVKTKKKQWETAEKRQTRQRQREAELERWRSGVGPQEGNFQEGATANRPAP